MKVVCVLAESQLSGTGLSGGSHHWDSGNELQSSAITKLYARLRACAHGEGLYVPSGLLHLAVS